ncbi:hypothetical protein [Novimethylophilus kurashikiensis]|uniref:hypothetical protein n=1 Tax=Novimethylophilus kurashikiensis TaxID=1825523 RepID=UPI0011B293A5|nr:hypothetical protein [Novimethylophilus kurashikiensis]
MVPPEIRFPSANISPGNEAIAHVDATHPIHPREPISGLPLNNSAEDRKKKKKDSSSDPHTSEEGHIVDDYA